jgi:AcrR family transcriptional regulator
VTSRPAKPRSKPDQTPRTEAKRAPRRAYHHGDLANALLDAADALVAEKGVAGFSLREAARVVGVDPAACYRHFRDREAVIQGLARRGFTRLAAAFADVTDAARRKKPVDVVRALGHAYCQFAFATPSAFRAMFGPNGFDARDPRLRGDYRDGVGAFERLQRTISTWAEADGLSLDLEDASLGLWSGVHGFAMLVIDGSLLFNHDAHRDRVLDSLLSTMISGFKARGKI